MDAKNASDKIPTKWMKIISDWQNMTTVQRLKYFPELSDDHLEYVKKKSPLHKEFQNSLPVVT